MPAIVISALIWPGPGVAISSAMHEIGTWPSTSGAPRTRLRQRPNSKPSANSGGVRFESDQAIGFENIAPPSRSRLPVSTLTTSTSQDVSVPNSWLQVPMRP